MPMQLSLLSACRTIHIYLSVLGLGVMLFFGITGFVAHHSDWFGDQPNRRELSGTTPAALIEKDDRLGVVEHLRKAFAITGAVESYSANADQVTVSFREPGREWDLDIDKSSGKTGGEARIFGLAGILKDLHRAQNTGAAWAWVIDIGAGLLVIASVTGLILWCTLPRRRKIGVIALLLGTVLALGVYWKMVPGAGKKLAPGTVETTTEK